MAVRHRITPCLWFDDRAEEAAHYYAGIFPDSRITLVTRYSDVGTEVHGRPAGSVMVVAFELDGHAFTALNGGPHFTFNEALSLQVSCRDQAEIDHYWTRLGEGGDPRARQCGWLKDRYGVSWQVVPDRMDEMFADSQSPGAGRVMAAMLKMKKIDIAEIERAYAGA